MSLDCNSISFLNIVRYWTFITSNGDKFSKIIVDNKNFNFVLDKILTTMLHKNCADDVTILEKFLMIYSIINYSKNQTYSFQH